MKKWLPLTSYIGLSCILPSLVYPFIIYLAMFANGGYEFFVYIGWAVVGYILLQAITIFSYPFIKRIPNSYVIGSGIILFILTFFIFKYGFFDFEFDLEIAIGMFAFLICLMLFLINILIVYLFSSPFSENEEKVIKNIILTFAPFIIFFGYFLCLVILYIVF